MIPAVGYRFWRVDSEDSWTCGQLQSPVSETLWPPRDKLRAECQRRRGLAPSRPHLHTPDAPTMSPVPECTCGIYSWHEVTTMVRTLKDESVMFGGAVLCWGRIVIHPEGLRAQYARPLALCLPATQPAHDRAAVTLNEVARAYGIPLLDLDYLEAYAHEFGASYKPEPRSSWFDLLKRTAAAGPPWRYLSI